MVHFDSFLFYAKTRMLSFWPLMNEFLPFISLFYLAKIILHWIWSEDCCNKLFVKWRVNSPVLFNVMILNTFRNLLQFFILYLAGLCKELGCP